MYTAEPPIKGHVGTRSFILYREVFPLFKVIIGIGMSRFVLYREVSFIQSVLYQRFHCIIIITPIVQSNEVVQLNLQSYKNIVQQNIKS